MLFKASFDVYFTINVPFINNGCYISVTNQCKGFSDSVHSLCCEGFSKIHHPAFFIVWRDASFADKLVSQTKALAHRAALIKEMTPIKACLTCMEPGKGVKIICYGEIVWQRCPRAQKQPAPSPLSPPGPLRNSSYFNPVCVQLINRA